MIKGLQILEAIVRSDTPRGVTDLARELGIEKSAVQRTVQALAKVGYLERQDDSARYGPTLLLWELGALVSARHEVRRQLHPLLRYGAALTELSVYLAWADFPDVLYLDKVEGVKGRPNSKEIGTRVPMLESTAGRAILAHLDGAAAEEAARQRPGAAPATPAALGDGLARIRQAGYAVTEPAPQARAISIAAPVWDRRGRPFAAIAVSSDTAALPETDFARIGAIALDLADQATTAVNGTRKTP